MELDLLKEVEGLPEDLLKEGLEKMDLPKEGELVEGVVAKVEGDLVFIDVGGKSEGVVPLSEFGDKIPRIGEKVLVYVEKAEGTKGVKLSKYKADFERAWDRIWEAFQSGELVEGRITKRVKGGFMVNIFGVEAFMPRSLSGDVGKTRTLSVGKTVRVKIIKADRLRKTIIVSRKDAIEEEEIAVKKRLAELKPGMVVEGYVSGIIEHGIFVDIGGVEGFVHISELAWHRPKKIEDVVKQGQKITAKILDVDPEKKRISLSVKQLLPHPWEKVAEKYPIGSKVKGRVKRIVDYGAFVELEPGVEGLVHISEMRWGRPPSHPSELLKEGDEIEAIVLNVDVERQRISLGIKQTQPDPWTTVHERYAPGTKVEGKIYDFDQYGAFVELPDGLVGYLHVANISWTRKFKHPSDALRKGKRATFKVIDIDDRQRFVELSLKHLVENPWPKIQEQLSEGTVVSVKVVGASEAGLIVMLKGDGYEIEGFVPRSQLAKGKRPSDYEIGSEIRVAVMSVDPNRKRILFSERKYLQMEREAERLKERKEIERVSKRLKKEKAVVSLGDILKSEIERLKQMKEE